ncbi:MAG: hypothetical protein HYU58_09205 [Proteobacteria bacterium]|nr:hypothetical protein [Pseudomonadota bacterium]
MNAIHWLSEMGPLALLATLSPLMIPALVAGIAVATERTGKVLSRGRYSIGLVLWVLLPYALYLGGWMIFSYFYFTRDPAATAPTWALADYFWEVYGLRIAFDSALSFSGARLLVRRLRGADINGKLAYLAVLPYLRIFVLLAFAFYPPSRRDKAIPVEIF